MAAKTPFTQHEAVLLLDAYLKWQSGKLARGAAVRECSSKLRQMAINANLQIDGSYRNVSCIWPQMASMDSAFQGHTVRVPASRLFTETVSLYRDNPAKYQELLQEAESMAVGGNESEPPAPNPTARPDEASETKPGYGGGGALEKAFCGWLKEDRRLQDAECSEQVSSIKRAELFAQGNGLASKRLFTEDFSEAMASAAALFGNAEFVRLDAEQGNGLKKAITALLSFYGAGGGGARDEQDVNLASDDAPQTAGLEDEFLRYLKEKTSLAERSCHNYVYYIKKAESLAQEYGLEPHKLFTKDAGEAAATANALFACADFVQYSKEHRNNFKSAIKSLLAFYGVEWSLSKVAQPQGPAQEETGGQDANHLVDDAPQTADGAVAVQPEPVYGGGSSLEDEFLRYLKEETSLAERTRSNYVFYIKTAERLAQEYGLEPHKLFTKDADEAAATADALFACEGCIQHLHRRGYNFKAAIRSLLAFYESVGGAKKSEEGVNHLEDDVASQPRHGYGAARDEQDMDQLQLIEQLTEQLTEPSFDVAPYLAIIEEHFANGYRLASPIDADKMRQYYKEMTGAEMHVDADALAAALRRRCVACNGKAYAPQSLLNDEMKAQILSFIEGCLEGGADAVYYKAIFEKFEDELIEGGSKIRGEEMLKAYLQCCAAGEYCFGEACLTKGRYERVNPIEDLRRYLEEQCAPVKLAAICKALPHIDAERIEGALRRQDEFLQNGKDEFFYADALQLDVPELEAIAHLIEERGSIAVDELYEAIQKNCADAFERNAVFSAIGWKNALKQKLETCGFSFGEKIVSVEGAPKSKIELFARCVKENAGGGARLSLEQLEQYAESCALANIPFDALYARGGVVRVSRDLFVPKGDVWFSVAETDAALERFFGSQQYMMIGDIETAVLPAAAFAWTEFLLEQYAAFYSEEFCLLHKAFNKKSAFGAIVKKPCRFGSLDELLLDSEGNA